MANFLSPENSIETATCTTILDDFFGPVVAAVGGILLSETLPLPLLNQRLRPRFKVHEIRKAVVLLVRHGIVQFNLDSRNNITYQAHSENVIRLIRSPRCVLAAKTLYGESAEAICEEIVNEGRLSCSECIRRVTTRLELQDDDVKEQFMKLVEAHFIMRCPKAIDLSHGCPQFEVLNDLFVIPECVTSAIDKMKKQSTGPPENRKRKLVDSVKDEDADILWRLNYVRFERYLRDEMIVNLCTATSACGNSVNVLRILLKVCELKTAAVAASSLPVSVHDVVRASNSPGPSLERRDVEVALRLFSEDGSGIVRKVGDSAGGLFVVDFEKAIVLQCQKLVESCIRESLDRRAVRIYRLLLQKGSLEEDQIEKLAMLPSKETRELCFQLIEGKFITITHVAKTTDFAPARTFYLYNVDLSIVAHTLYIITYKALRNVLVRRMHETKENKVLIDRQFKMETIAANIEADENLDDATKDQQVAEVEESYLTAGDRTILEKYKKRQAALLGVEAKLENDLLVFSAFLDFARRRV